MLHKAVKLYFLGVVQLVERLIRDQGVGGSSPLTQTKCVMWRNRIDARKDVLRGLRRLAAHWIRSHLRMVYNNPGSSLGITPKI